MSRYENKNPYSWMPGFLRRFMNLEYDEPVASPEPSARPTSSTVSSYAAEPTSPAVARWSPPSDPSFTASNMEAYAPPAGNGFLPASAGRTYSGDANPSAPIVQGQVDVISITAGARGFVRGALPPQGIEAFSKELIGTTNSVWDMYTRWFIFETGDIIKAGATVVKAVAGLFPSSSSPATTSRRIKVTIANGDQEASPIKIEE
ncbi:MAG: hypothetical protein HGA65_08595 [Oscillochloris sp.]|nr:hypothetical protein [Oscillochloris sp.]